jgi:hypothetical protein
MKHYVVEIQIGTGPFVPWIVGQSEEKSRMATQILQGNTQITSVRLITYDLVVDNIEVLK